MFNMNKLIKVNKSTRFVMHANNAELIEICETFIHRFYNYSSKAKKLKRFDLASNFDLGASNLKPLIEVLKTTDKDVCDRKRLRCALKHYEKLSFELIKIKI